MDIELLGQFGQRLLAPHGGQSHLRFESRRVVPAGSSAHRLSCSAAILAALRQKRHLSNPFKNPEPALSAPLSGRCRSRSRRDPIKLSEADEESVTLPALASRSCGSNS